MILYIRHLSLFLLILSLVGCQANPTDSIQPVSYPTPPNSDQPTSFPPSSNSDQSASYPSPEPYSFRQSKPGTVSVHGTLTLTSPMAMVPDPNDGIYLVPLQSGGEGISTIPEFTVGEVPQADVDEVSGEFMITDLEPGMYAVVVLTRNGMQVPASLIETGNLAIITLEEKDRNQTVELGILRIP